MTRKARTSALHSQSFKLWYGRVCKWCAEHGSIEETRCWKIDRKRKDGRKNENKKTINWNMVPIGMGWGIRMYPKGMNNGVELQTNADVGGIMEISSRYPK